MSKVHVLTVDNIGGLGELGYDDASNVLTALFSSRELAHKYLAAYCRGEWERQGGHDGRLSNDDELAIDRFFDFWSDEMEWDISEKDMDPDPATVEQSAEFAAGPEDEE